FGFLEMTSLTKERLAPSPESIRTSSALKRSKLIYVTRTRKSRPAPKLRAKHMRKCVKRWGQLNLERGSNGRMKSRFFQNGSNLWKVPLFPRSNAISNWGQRASLATRHLNAAPRKINGPLCDLIFARNALCAGLNVQTSASIKHPMAYTTSR